MLIICALLFDVQLLAAVFILISETGDFMVVGAGLRLPPSQLDLFEGHCQVERKYAHRLKVTDYRNVIFRTAKTGLPTDHIPALISLKRPDFGST
jgi:hypothetical protein